MILERAAQRLSSRKILQFQVVECTHRSQSGRASGEAGGACEAKSRRPEESICLFGTVWSNLLPGVDVDILRGKDIPYCENVGASGEQ